MGELFVEQPPEQRPDLVLVTEYSAIPIADAVRGFFSGLHESAPRISTIKANRDAFRKTEQNTIAGYRSRLRTRRETARLASDRVSYGHYLPCVIDQYVDSGRTMQYAFKLLQTAGYSAITAVNGQWYQQAELEPADIREVTSCFANELHAIGQQASERFTNKSVY